MIYCKICGSELEDGCDFCKTCGTKVKKDNVESTKSDGLNYYHVDHADTSRREDKPKIRKNLMSFRLIVILSLVIIFGGAGTLYTVQNVLNDNFTVKTLVEPSLAYDSMNPYGEGLICVSKNGKWGYIDKNGEVVIPLIYDFADFFSEGLAAVCKDGKWGYIDKNGEVVIPLIYDFADYFNGGVAYILSGNNVGYIDKTGEVVVLLKYSSYISYLGDGLILVYNDDENETVIEDIDSGNVIFRYDSISSFGENGLAAASKDGKWGFINKKGEVVIPLVYDTARNFSDGLAAVGMIDDTNATLLPTWRNSWYYKYGYIDTTGKLVIPMIYNSAYDFSEGAAVVLKYDFSDKTKSSPLALFGVIDKTGETIIPLGENGISNFTDGLAEVYSYDSNIPRKSGVINLKGELVVPAIYDDVYILGDKSGLIEIYKDNKYGIIDSKGNEVVPLIYDEIGMLRDGLMTVEKDGLWGILEVKK
ncbi:MAG: WG repeat-containing protein [Oscillospiraceae bacterium]|nr:WG repeat-containing protein [Oscillospiraceae bacterium]